MAVLGMVEFSGIARGIRAADAMVKAAPVELLEARPIDPGKFLAVVTGDEASVEASVEAGVREGAKRTLAHFMLANIHDAVLGALRAPAKPPKANSIGILETRHAASIVLAADAAAKAAPIGLVSLRLALRLGGKGYCVFAGTVADVEAAVDAGERIAGDNLVESAVIPNPYPETFAHLLDPDHSWRTEGSER